jgi:hypothetical protein
LSHEERLALLESITGAEAIIAQLPAPVEATFIDPMVTSIQPTKSVYHPGETIDAIITFSGPITLNTFINIKTFAGPLETVYLPSQTGSAPATLFTVKTQGPNADFLEMHIGETTARYTGPKYPGGVNFINANISAKTTINGVDRQEYVTSSTISLIDETM